MIREIGQIELKTPWVQIVTPYPVKKPPEKPPEVPPPPEKPAFPWLPLALAGAGLILLIYVLRRK